MGNQADGVEPEREGVVAIRSAGEEGEEGVSFVKWRRGATPEVEGRDGGEGDLQLKVSEELGEAACAVGETFSGKGWVRQGTELEGGNACGPG